MTLITRLVYARRHPALRRPIREMLALWGVEFPPQAEVGAGLVLEHRAFGLVVSGAARLGKNVRLYQGVTIGGADVYNTTHQAEAIVIEDDVIICAGAKVLAGAGTLTVGRGTIIAANAVLLTSTGPGEVWGGVPARKLR